MRLKFTHGFGLRTRAHHFLCLVFLFQTKFFCGPYAVKLKVQFSISATLLQNGDQDAAQEPAGANLRSGEVLQAASRWVSENASPTASSSAQREDPRTTTAAPDRPDLIILSPLSGDEIARLPFEQWANLSSSSGEDEDNEFIEYESDTSAETEDEEDIDGVASPSSRSYGSRTSEIEWLRLKIAIARVTTLRKVVEVTEQAELRLLVDEQVCRYGLPPSVCMRQNRNRTDIPVARLVHDHPEGRPRTSRRSRPRDVFELAAEAMTLIDPETNTVVRPDEFPWNTKRGTGAGECFHGVVQPRLQMVTKYFPVPTAQELERLNALCDMKIPTAVKQLEEIPEAFGLIQGPVPFLQSAWGDTCKLLHARYVTELWIDLEQALAIYGPRDGWRVAEEKENEEKEEEEQAD
ncbi:unnamed protein product [Amoebophrya sp. A120]|nr:unnamed protein product [Amoebophrya sp. A120]|eukprot:GSA120T00011609001.1